MRPSLLRLTTLFAFTAVALTGCGGHSKSNKAAAGTTTAPTTSGTTTGGGSTTAPPTSSSTSTATLTFTPVALTAAQEVQQVPGELPALVFTLEAGTDDVEVEQIDVDASGTVDETALGGASLIEDANANGAVDQGETPLATAPAPTTDDGRYRFVLSAPLSVSAGQSRQLIVRLDASNVLPSTALVGKTVVLAVADAASLVAHDTASTPVTASGAFGAASAGVTLGINSHLLISEVFFDGGGALGGEFVEIYNPTGRSVDLTNVFLTDYTSGNNTVAHFRIVEGANFGPVQAGSTNVDWLVRFPAGATLASGQAVTVAVDAGGFANVFGQDADYCMRNKGATASTQMLTWDGTAALGFSAADVGGSAGLSDTGECVFLYTWDPAQPTDLITDLDIVVYGSLTPTNYPTDKGAITIDSAFDADRATSTYEAETSLMDQDLLRADPTRAANAIDRSIQRVDYTEGLETRSPGTGNGTGDHDETSEDLMTTFDVLTPTPSTAP